MATKTTQTGTAGGDAITGPLVKRVLKRRHRHAGKEYQAGDTIAAHPRHIEIMERLGVFEAPQGEEVAASDE